MQEIRERILAAEEGSVFSTSDFADIADTNTVRSALYRLIQDGILRRILNGVYEKPKYSKLLDEYVASDPEAVANALARSYHWTIAPCGNTALNLLGLHLRQRQLYSIQRPGVPLLVCWQSIKKSIALSVLFCEYQLSLL